MLLVFLLLKLWSMKVDLILLEAIIAVVILVVDVVLIVDVILVVNVVN